MSYIGRSPQIGGYYKIDNITCDGSASYTMQLDSANFVPESVNHLIVSVNGVIQAPTDSFTVSGSTITFASSLSVSDTIDFIMALGNVLDIGVPSDSTVSSSKIIDGAVSLAKLSATGTKDATTFLRGDNTFAEVPAGGITMADQWRVNTDFTGDNAPISSNWEQVDTGGQGTLGTAMSESSGVFTFPETGIYLVTFQLTYFASNSSSRTDFSIQVTTDNSAYTNVALGQVNGTSGQNAYSTSFINTLIDVTDTSNVKVRFKNNNQDNSNTIQGNTNYNATSATFIRMGDT
jgi:hypothetical protein